MLLRRAPEDIAGQGEPETRPRLVAHPFGQQAIHLGRVCLSEFRRISQKQSAIEDTAVWTPNHIPQLFHGLGSTRLSGAICRGIVGSCGFLQASTIKGPQTGEPRNPTSRSRESPLGIEYDANRSNVERYSAARESGSPVNRGTPSH